MSVLELENTEHGTTDTGHLKLSLDGTPLASSLGLIVNSTVFASLELFSTLKMRMHLL